MLMVIKTNFFASVHNLPFLLYAVTITVLMQLKERGYKKRLLIAFIEAMSMT